MLFIHHVSSYGGSSYCLYNLIKNLDAEIFSPHVILKNDGPLVEELKMLGIPVTICQLIEASPYNKSLFRIRTILSYMKIFLFRGLLAMKIKSMGADIIYLNTMMLGLYAKKLNSEGVSIVLHMRELWPKDSNKFQYNLLRNNIDLYCHKIIAINKTSAENLKILEKTSIVYDAVDFNGRDNKIDFHSLIGNDWENYKIILFIGGIQRIKGSLDVLKIFNKNISDDNTKLLFVGFDNNRSQLGLRMLIKKIIEYLTPYKSYSSQIIKIINNNNRIITIKSTNQIKSLIENSTCLINFPTTRHALLPIAESIALGTPVVAPNTPEAKEYSLNGEAANLYAFRDGKDFLITLQKVLQDNFNEAIRTQTFSNDIKDKFSITKNSQTLNEILCKM